MRPLATLLFAGLLASALSATSCGSPADLKQTTRITDVSSGWFDVGVQPDGKNKLVPSLTFRIAKNPGTSLSTLSLNVVFRKAGEQEHADDVFLQTVEFEGDSTAPIVVRSSYGYTGEQSRVEMLKHSEFRDMEAQVFAKQSSSQWVALHDVKIDRQVIVR